MAGSLQDQLLKAGLVDKKKAKRAERDKQIVAKQKRQGEDVVDEAKALAEKAKQEKLAKDKELNQEQKEKAEKKAIAAQIKQLIEMNALDLEGAEIRYNFTDGKKVKYLNVTELAQHQLSRGLLVIAKRGDRYFVLPSIVADKISQRDDSYIVHKAEITEAVADEDDPYADYQIPDDLMW